MCYVYTDMFYLNFGVLVYFYFTEEESEVGRRSSFLGYIVCEWSVGI